MRVTRRDINDSVRFWVDTVRRDLLGRRRVVWRSVRDGGLPVSTIRPLVRRADGVWKSRDGRWTFRRHYGDPHPQRWFAYLDNDEAPANDGEGHTTLRDAADWAAEVDLDGEH